jgi:flavin-binding protein dodecin
MRNPVTNSNQGRQPRCRRGWRWRVMPALVTTLLACMPAFSGIAGQPSTEYRIKAAFLYNFTSFVTWPDDKSGEAGFVLCVLGNDPFGNLLDKLAGKSVNGRQLVIRRLDSLALVDQCKLVFISEAASDRIGDALMLLHELPVLTVSDTRGFTELGGIIEFRIIANKVRFDINLKAAESAGLNISSKLLSLATRFRQKD